MAVAGALLPVYCIGHCDAVAGSTDWKALLLNYTFVSIALRPSECTNGERLYHNGACARVRAKSRFVAATVLRGTVRC